MASTSSFVPPPKRRKLQARGNDSTMHGTHKVAISLTPSPAISIGLPNLPKVDYKAKRFAEMEAQKDGCVGSYRSFDSPYGNFLVPVIPTRSDLFGS